MIETHKKSLEQYISIFEGDAVYMASDAYGWGNKETSGPLYGTFTHRHRPLVMAACPGGPKTTREQAHCAFDADYVEALTQHIHVNFGMQYLGTWHSHHHLGLNRPSTGDVGQNNRLVGRYNIDTMVQIVLTHQKLTAPKQEAGIFNGIKEMMFDSGRSIVKEADTKKARRREIKDNHSIIRINAFIYEKGANANIPCTRCPVKILPGQSPVKAVLDDSGLLDIPGSPVEVFPFERIIYEERPFSGTDTEQYIPYILRKQLNELSDEIALRTKIYTYNGQMVLSLPLSDGLYVSVTYAPAQKSPPRIYSVNVVYPDIKTAVDLTKDILMGDGYVSLNLIQRHAENKVRGGKIKQVGFAIGGEEYFGPKLNKGRAINGESDKK